MGCSHISHEVGLGEGSQITQQDGQAKAAKMIRVG